MVVVMVLVLYVLYGYLFLDDFLIKLVLLICVYLDVSVRKEVVNW